MNPQIWLVIRYLLIALGSALATKGWVETSQWASFVDALQPAVGALMTVGGMAWGLYVRIGTRAVPKEVAARPEVPVINAATGKEEKA